jgi:hypothetical protein
MRLDSTPLASQSPATKRVSGAFDILNRICPKGTSIEIPANRHSFSSYAVKFSRAGGGELFLLHPASKADDSPWLCLAAMRGANEEELVKSEEVYSQLQQQALRKLVTDNTTTSSNTLNESPSKGSVLTQEDAEKLKIETTAASKENVNNEKEPDGDEK